MSLRAAAIATSLLILLATPVFACSAKSAMSTMAVDPLSTASMAMAAPVEAGKLTIEGYWIKAMLPGQPVAGGFLSIANNGADDDILVAASSPQSGRIELHEMMMNGDVMEMRALEKGIAIAAGTKVELAPGGLHLMFFDVTETFKEGDLVPVTLVFEKAGAVELMLPVIAKAMHH